jgi:hypothetical protein
MIFTPTTGPGAPDPDGPAAGAARTRRILAIVPFAMSRKNQALDPSEYDERKRQAARAAEVMDRLGRYVASGGQAATRDALNERR